MNTYRRHLKVGRRVLLKVWALLAAAGAEILQAGEEVKPASSRRFSHRASRHFPFSQRRRERDAYKGRQTRRHASELKVSGASVLAARGGGARVSWEGGGRRVHLVAAPRQGGGALLVSRPHFLTSHQKRLRKASLCKFSTISRMHGVHFYAAAVFSGSVLRQAGGREEVAEGVLRIICSWLFRALCFSLYYINQSITW